MGKIGYEYKPYPVHSIILSYSQSQRSHNFFDHSAEFVAVVHVRNCAEIEIRGLSLRDFLVKAIRIRQTIVDEVAQTVLFIYCK